MARHNFAELTGYVRRPPQIMGPYVICTVGILAPTRSQAESRVEGYAGVCLVIVSSAEEEIKQRMLAWQANDVVYMKGFVGTRQELKNYQCPQCGYEDDSQVMAVGGIDRQYGFVRTYIHPIHVELRMRPEDGMEEALGYVTKEAKEVSNIIMLVGNLTADPEPKEWKNPETERVTDACRYKIAVNRKYCPSGMDEICEDTDFPVIYTFGAQAKWDQAVLHRGSSVLVDGALVTRRVRINCKCPQCGTEFLMPDTRVEVVGNSVEYGHGIDFESYYALATKAKESNDEEDAYVPELMGKE